MRVIVSGFYNTLIDKEGAIPTSTMFEFDRLKPKGVKLILLYQRMLEDVLYYNASFPFIQYIIAYNGSILYDVEEEKILYRKELDDGVVAEIEKRIDPTRMIYYTEKGGVRERPNESIYKIEIESFQKKDQLLLSDLNVFLSSFDVNGKSYLEISPTTFYQTFLSFFSTISVDKITAIIGNMSEADFIYHYPNTYVVANASKELKKLTKKRTKSDMF